MNQQLHITLLLPLLAAATFTASAHAADADGEAIVKKARCVACHAVDAKRVGPAYKEVAAKYKADKGAEAKLAEKVVKGGSGVWGQVPMPPNPQVSADEAKTLVKWILAM